MSKKSVTVYCSIATNLDPDFYDMARAVGRGLAERQNVLIYGGCNRGLMGAVADGALETGGHVVGVFPNVGELKPYKHEGLSEMVLVDEMQARKRVMFERADAFVILPGGYGTLDEAFEVLTLNKVGILKKKVYFLNHNGFWNAMNTMLEGFIAARTMNPEHRDFYKLVDTLPELLAALAADDNLA